MSDALAHLPGVAREAQSQAPLMAERKIIDDRFPTTTIAHIYRCFPGRLCKDGKPVSAAFVVLVDADLRSPRQLKIIYRSADETRNRFQLPQHTGRSGPYWWLTADELSPQDGAFLP